MLQINDVFVNYGRVAAVRGVSVEARAGEVTLILGANGAGKSTLLRTICGLLRPHRGSIEFESEDITSLQPHAIVNRGLVLVPEGRQILAPMSVRENLRMGGFVATRHDREENLKKNFELFPILAQRSEGQAGLLSGGEQQMLAFGRAMMSSPKFILMDEPSMGLSPVMVEVVMEKVRQIADSGVGVLMVEQNAEMGLEVADRVVVVARGEVAFAGLASVARSHSSVISAFLGEAALERHD